MNKCFVCDKKLKQTKYLVITIDGQTVYVGPECFKRIIKTPGGYQPPLGGPKLYYRECLTGI